MGHSSSRHNACAGAGEPMLPSPFVSLRSRLRLRRRDRSGAAADASESGGRVVAADEFAGIARIRIVKGYKLRVCTMQERKNLLKGSFRDRRFNAGSVLLGLGVVESVSGALNTWLRTGKLFPGPHLFAGAVITVLWATAAALVPAMQKGNEMARSLHIALNTINVLLLLDIIPTTISQSP